MIGYQLHLHPTHYRWHPSGKSTNLMPIIGCKFVGVVVVVINYVRSAYFHLGDWKSESIKASSGEYKLTIGGRSMS